MKIAICDDDLICRAHIERLVKEYIAKGNHNISVTVYEHGDDLLEDAIKIGGYDIYLLDVLMPDTDGIKLGLSLREAGLNGKILYLTSSEEYALDAFRAKASNYILKPVNPEILFPVLDEVIGWISSRVEKGILIKTKEGNVKVPFDNILYAELNNRAIEYHLVNGQILISNTIRNSFSEAIQELLQETHFSMCGASVLVNLHHITMIKAEEVLFKNGASIYISKRVSKELRSVWSEF